MTSEPPQQTPVGGPFAQAVVDYAQAGWPCILPVPPATKTPPPTGYTGAEGRDTDPATLVGWATDPKYAGYSIALRLPLGVIGIDVDQYVKKGLQKHGGQTLAACLERWGPLPATWTSTAREPNGPSRIYFFRVPPQRYATKLTSGPGADGTPGTSDVEVIQHHHRYAVVWPSPHQDAGSTYQWYDPHGNAVDAPPKPNELPELPPAWVAGLAEGATDQGPASADVGSGFVLLEQLLTDDRPECADITSARLQALDELSRVDAGSRHDTATARVHHLVQLAAHGHTGFAGVADLLRGLWADLTAGEDRGEELERMLLTSARKAVTAVGPHQVPRDPCSLMTGGLPMPAPGDPSSAPPPVDKDGNPVDLHIVEQPRWVLIRESIGTHAFDPNAGLDQPLAEAVLARVYPALRFAYDAGGWLVRTNDRWELHKKLESWAVAQVATLMPVGDPTTEKGSDQYERSKRRARFMSAAGAGAVSKMMGALVIGGMHPAAVALADLDSDPEVLWAGGLPYSLRFSDVQPIVAEHIDPATPHLHAAAVVPQRRETPLWDAFTAAVWPDPELRAWALRVLSIAVTGYADRALPILLGETGRGKTQLIHLMMSVLGTYGHAANPKLLGSGSNEHDTIVFALKGRRLSFIDEAPSEAKAGQERLKQLTGGGELEARQMNQDPITFRPTHTLVLTANDEPVLTDPAVRARVRLIPCEGDPELVRSTRAALGHVSGPAWRVEAPGVLAEMMAQAAAWLDDPTTTAVTSAPESIRYLAEHIGAEQDPVAVWVEEETEPFEEGTASRELYQAFVASCRRNSMRPDAIPTETKWGRALTRLGYPAKHTEHGKRRALRLRQGGGQLPVTTVPTPAAFLGTPDAPVQGPDGLEQNADGFMTGSDPNPSAVKRQVNPSVSVEPDGSDGLENPLTHIHTPAHAHEARAEHTLNPSSPLLPASSEPAADLREDPPALFEADPSAQPVIEKPPRKKREQTAEARERKAQAAAEKRQAAIAEAAGEHIGLPAVVTRDGVPRPAALEDLDALLGTITEITVDVETTGYLVGHEHFELRTVQLGNEHFAVVLDPTQADQADVVRRHLARAEILHAHSATADLVPLTDAGLVDAESAWARMDDTVVRAKLADPASTGSDPGLKQISVAMLGERGLSKPADEARAALFKAGKWLTETEVTTPLERSGWAQVDSGCATMVRYAAADVLDDAAIARLLPRPSEAILTRERTAQRMTAPMAHTGLRFDPVQIERLTEEHLEAKAAHAERVQAFGIDNPGSDQQVGAALVALGAPLPRTATGRPSVAAGVLDPFRALEGSVGELAGAVLDYRHHKTALSLFLEPWGALVRRGDGRARSTIYTLAADTGRMSSVRFNFQQISREGGLRSCITADPGHLLASADFAGVELRTAAGLSQDRGLMAILADPDRDLHGEIAHIAFGAGFTKSNRYATKRGVFGRIYGGGVGAIARGVGVSEAVARQIIDAMDQLTPGLTEWSRQVRDSIESGRTQFPTYSGRVIHLPKKAPHAGPNYCIQGTARELLIDALMRWRETRWGEATLLPVHDELVVMVPEAEAQDATDELVRCMTTDLLGVPIIAEASEPSYAWSDSA